VSTDLFPRANSLPSRLRLHETIRCVTTNQTPCLSSAVLPYSSDFARKGPAGVRPVRRQAQGRRKERSPDLSLSPARRLRPRPQHPAGGLHLRIPRPLPGERTKYADFVWPGRCLIEMKSRGVKLSKHYQQTFDYWLHLVPHRPPYVALCNFDEFWIYDFNTQLHEPMDKVPVGRPARTPRRAQFPVPPRLRAPLRPQLGRTSPAKPPKMSPTPSTRWSRAARTASAPAASSSNAWSPCSPRTSFSTGWRRT
jgi:hypothetical protein